MFALSAAPATSFVGTVLEHSSNIIGKKLKGENNFREKANAKYS